MDEILDHTYDNLARRDQPRNNQDVSDAHTRQTRPIMDIAAKP
jgi:hypothetical protein